jgi:hypothetical protein
VSFQNLRRLALIAALFHPGLSFAYGTMIEFPASEPARWNYVSDQIRGGVLDGRMLFDTVDNQPLLRLIGHVSTAYRGGFSQTRTKLDVPLPDTAQSIVLTVRGNVHPYDLHMGTRYAVLPWQLCEAKFEPSNSRPDARVPFEAFTP